MHLGFRMNIDNRNLTKSVFIIMMISILGKFLGLARESVLAAYFGASGETDAYKLAFGIPSILLFAISVGLATTFIPIYSSYLRSRTKEETQYFLNNIFNLVVVLSVVITLLGVLAAPYIVKYIAIGFDASVLQLTVTLTIISLPCMIFFAMFNMGSAYLESNGKFATPAMSWIIYDIIIIGSIVLFYRNGIKAITVGSLLAVASLFLIQLPVILRNGYRYKLVFDLREKGFRKMVTLTGPVIIGSAFNQIYIFIERMFASGLQEGSISALDYAYKVNSIVFNIFSLSIITVIYPKLASLSEEMPAFKASLIKGIRAISLISLPTMVFICLFSSQIVTLLFQRGAFDITDTKLTSFALVGFSIGIIGMGMRELFNKAFYALNDTKTPMINGIIVICINIVLCITFVKLWGVGGLAAATSLSALISCCILACLLRKRIGTIIGKESRVLLLKGLSATLVMVGMVSICKRYIDVNFEYSGVFIIEAGKLLINVCIGAIAYAGMLYILRVEEFKSILKIIHNFIITRFVVKRFVKG